MNRQLGLVLASAIGLSGGVSRADAQPAPAPIEVESPAIKHGERIGREYTPDGHNVSPPLAWRNLPRGTRSLAVICADFGAGQPPPWVHWVMYNIPAAAKGLPEGLPIDPAAAMPADLVGASQGMNSWRRPIYRGPAPPVGTTHIYHFTVYAIDADLGLAPNLTRAELLDAIKGHVIGRGELMATYERRPLKAAP
jgi:Raf kinase inhibitor-like YbhB/YbcL family protein